MHLAEQKVLCNRTIWPEYSDGLIGEPAWVAEYIDQHISAARSSLAHIVQYKLETTCGFKFNCSGDTISTGASAFSTTFDVMRRGREQLLQRTWGLRPLSCKLQ